MAGVILGSAPLHPHFAQVLHRYMSACSGILYPTLYASYLACKTTRQFTLSGAYGRWHSRFNGKKREMKWEIEIEIRYEMPHSIKSGATRHHF